MSTDQQNDSYQALENRIKDLESQLAGLGSKKDPWWSNLSIIAPVFAALITGVISWTTIQIEDRRQQEAISQKYLELAVEGETGPERRATLLSFYSQVVRDTTLRRWAEARLDEASADIAVQEVQEEVVRLEELTNSVDQDVEQVARARESLQDSQRRGAVEGLIASSETVRKNSAQTLVNEFNQDPALFGDLLDFAQRHLKNELALYNVAAVLAGVRVSDILADENQAAYEDLKEVVQAYAGTRANALIADLP